MRENENLKLNLSEKFRANLGGILLYGLTPPKLNLSVSEAKNLAQIQLERLRDIEIDGLVIYDLQDESARNKAKRTFEFSKTFAPEIYWRNYLKSAYEAVIYKAVGKYEQDELANFLCENSDCKNAKFNQIDCENLDEISSNNSAGFSKTSNANLISNCVFVGVSSKTDTPKISLNEAYKLKNRLAPHLNLGGICIPERHAKKGDEDLRVAQKTALGCGFFITQAVYNLENAKRFLDDYANLGIKKVPIIFTFTPCGSEKTLEFMRWLGIAVPQYFQERLFSAPNPLGESVRLGREMFEFLYKYGRAKGISVGANIESISTRKVEIAASIELLRDVKNIIKQAVF